MSAAPAPNPSTPNRQTPVPQTAAHETSRSNPETGRGNPKAPDGGREGRPCPPGQDPMDYDDGAWM